MEYKIIRCIAFFMSCSIGELEVDYCDAIAEENVVDLIRPPPATRSSSKIEELCLSSLAADIMCVCLMKNEDVLLKVAAQQTIYRRHSFIHYKTATNLEFELAQR